MLSALLLHQQQQTLLLGSISGLPRLVQPQLLLAACGGQQQQQQPQQQLLQRGPQSSPSLWQCSHMHTTAQAAASTSTSTSTSSNSSGSSSSSSGSSSAGDRGPRKPSWQKRQYEKRLHAYKSRLPRARKYGTALRDDDPAAFEQMRLVVGYYDLPQNRHKRRPPSPTHVTINNIQTLLHTNDVDPYYKLALLSYRSKLQNAELLPGLSKTRKFLGQLSAPPDFVPAHLEELTAAAAATATTQQQQRGQQQHHLGATEQQETQDATSSSNSSSTGAAGGDVGSSSSSGDSSSAAKS